MRLATFFLLPAVMVLGSLTACEPSVPEGRFACEVDEDCPDELVCRTRVRRCFSTQVDAGPSLDAGPRDAGMNDAGPSDSGASDAGTNDAGEASAGDAGT